MSFCHEHGTTDFCGECVYGSEVERLTAELAAAQVEARGWEEQSHSWQDRAENAECRIARLENELAQVRMDAARYRWLRDADNFPGDEGTEGSLWVDLCELSGAEFDEWIDRAMAEDAEESQT